jgi:hypothetical protein
MLYPTVDTKLDREYLIQGHKIKFKTIDLNQEWRSINKDLLAMV